MGCKAILILALVLVACKLSYVVSATSCSDEACAETECATCLQTDLERGEARSQRGEARSQSVMKNAIVEALNVSIAPFF